MGKFICNRNGVTNPMNYHETLVRGDIFECDPHSLHLEDLLNGMFSVYREPEPQPVTVPEVTSEQVIEAVSEAVEKAIHPEPVIEDAGVSPEKTSSDKWRKRFSQ